MNFRLNKDNENILVFGGSGLLGKCLIENYSTKKRIHAFVNNNKIKCKNVKSLKIKKTNFLKKYIKENNIKSIINLAGLTSIELCEANEKLSKETNYILPIDLAKLSKATKINYVFISTDNFKFRSKKSFENTVSKPLNNYGKHKRKSEKEILKIYPKSLIVRTNFFCIGSKKRKSFSDTIIENVKLKNEIGLFQDVYYTPIYGKYLIKYIFELQKKKKYGVFNVCSNEKISKYNFGLKICKIFNLNKKYIKRIYLKKRKDLVKRPLNMALDNYKLKKNLKIKVPSIDYQLSKMKSEFRRFNK